MKYPTGSFWLMMAMFVLAVGATEVRASPFKITPYPELLDGVCANLRHVSPAATPSLEGKELLLKEADRLHLPHDLRAALTERLRNNAFTISETQLWEPYESFDVTLQARSLEAGVLKAKFSSQRYSEYNEHVGQLPEEQRDAIRRAALMILAEVGHLPEIAVSDAGGVQFVYREACLVDDGPGLMTTFMQGRVREFDIATGALGPAVPLRPQKATISDPALAFSSNGASVVRVRAEQLERVFGDAATRDLMRAIYDEILELTASPDRMKARLLQIVPLFEQAYGIKAVNFHFDTTPTNTGGSGYYEHSSRAYTFYYDRFVQKLDRFVAREGLDLARPDDYGKASKYMFGELVNNAAHELTHAGQYQWIDRWLQDADSIPGILHARVADYQKNHRYKNTAWESHALIGIMGPADYDRYRYQPLEEDAWAVGGHAESLALELISVERDQGNVIVQAERNAPRKITPVVYAPQRTFIPSR